MDIWKSWIVNKPIAHRGLHDENIPENSLKAFERAIEKGFVIECDIYLTKDNEVVVFHDRNLKRMTGVEGLIDKFKLNELKKLRLCDKEYVIPTLQELLQLVKGKQPILIEIKGFTKTYKLERIAYKILKDYNGEYAIQSFNPYSVGWFRKNAPEVYRGQLSSSFKNHKMQLLRKFILKHMLLNKIVSKPHFIAYRADDLLKRSKRISKLPILGWTVKNQEEFNALNNLCDNIIFESFIPDKK